MGKSPLVQHSVPGAQPDIPPPFRSEPKLRRSAALPCPGHRAPRRFCSLAPSRGAEPAGSPRPPAPPLTSCKVQRKMRVQRPVQHPMVPERRGRAGAAAALGAPRCPIRGRGERQAGAEVAGVARSVGAGCRSPSGSRGGGEPGPRLKRATLRRRCRPAGWAGWRGGGCRQRRDAPPGPPQARWDPPAPAPALPREAGAAAVPRTGTPLLFLSAGRGSDRSVLRQSAVLTCAGQVLQDTRSVEFLSSFYI